MPTTTGRLGASLVAGLAAQSMYLDLSQAPRPTTVMGDFSGIEKRIQRGTVYVPGKPYQPAPTPPAKRNGENRRQYRERLRASGWL